MTTKEALKALEELGSESVKNIFKNHGAKEPFFGVKVGDMKKLLKQLKGQHDLALSLYQTGNSDAMYFAGLLCDPKKMSKKEIQDWADKAYWYMLSEFTVPWVAAESGHGWELALEWIEDDREAIAAAGWACLCSVIPLTPNEALDIPMISSLLDRVENEIHGERNRVRYAMNNFIIASGGYLSELNDKAKNIAKKVGEVKVNMGNTSCKVPLAFPYIEKMEKRNKLDAKVKKVRC